jgi:hypothetical protein
MTELPEFHEKLDENGNYPQRRTQILKVDASLCQIMQEKKIRQSIEKVGILGWGGGLKYVDKNKE